MQVFYSDVRDYFCEWDYLQEIINYLTPKTLYFFKNKKYLLLTA